MECPCCSREMGNGELEEFSRSMNALLDEDTSKLLKVDQAAVEQYRNDKSTYQRWRKVIADNMDDVRVFRRMTDESTEAETATERLQADLTHHQAKANDQKELLAESQPVADELRALVDAAKRWSEDANRIADKKIEINQKHADLSASTAHTGRDLRTVEREMAEKMEDKDNLTNKINKLNKEMSSLNNLLSQLSSQVSVRWCDPGRLCFYRLLLN
jgi:DNA repair exonuclease SbcCD ATPase subunit